MPKRKVKFAKLYEQSFSTEIFRVVKVDQRVPQPVYEPSYLYDQFFEGRFYKYELLNVTVLPRTEFLINKIACTHNKNCLSSFLTSGEDTTKRSILGQTLRYYENIMDHFYAT